jgi:threonine dehydrogenase-like Zn-dependent dehydrogenase
VVAGRHARPGRQLNALIFDGGLRLAQVPRPEPAGEALVRVRLAGICNTDLEVTRGYKGYRGILGHEFVGEVVESGDTRLLGRRVCGEINVGCGACSRCRSGNPGHCADRSVLGILNRDGAFAEYLRLPERNLHPISHALPDEAAVFAEPVAAAFEILEQVTVGEDDRIVVLGDGKLGLLCAQVLALTGARVDLAGHHDERRSLVAGAGVRWMEEREAQPGADLVIEATGSPLGFNRALSLVRPRGTLVLKSTVADPGAVDLNDIVVKEIVVVGSRCGPFPRAIAALEAGAVRVDTLISARYPLREGTRAMEHAARSGVLKVLLDPRAGQRSSAATS